MGGKVEVHSLPIPTPPPFKQRKGLPWGGSGMVSGRWSMMGGSLGPGMIRGFPGSCLSPSSNIKNFHPAIPPTTHIAVLLAPTVALARALLLREPPQ